MPEQEVDEKRIEELAQKQENDNRVLKGIATLAGTVTVYGVLIGKLWVYTKGNLDFYFLTTLSAACYLFGYANRPKRE